MSYNLGHVVGAAGKGIQSISKTGTSGLVDTYTITYTDGTTQTYTVTNGEDGTGGADIVTEWESTLSDEKIPSEKLTKNTLDLKLEGNKVTSWSGTVSDSNIPSEKLVKDSLDGKVTGTKVTSWSGTLADTHVPSEKLVKISLDGKQATLVSGSNIKTVNGNSLLGSGDITVGANAGSFGDLQDLIDEASSRDTIILDNDYKNTGSESEIEIDKPLTIIGNGHILDADGKSIIFNITDTTGECNISSLIFTNGLSIGSIGGAIRMKGSNRISDCVFTNNDANTGGGAIYSVDDAYNYIIKCVFDNNHSNSVGGAVAGDNKLRVYNCVFTNNSANTNGGAIKCTSDTDIRDCIFRKNTATNNGINVYNSSTDSLTIYNCHVTNSNQLYNTVNSEYVHNDDIANNLTTTTAGKVLDARQGKILYDLIAGIEEDMLQ